VVTEALMMGLFGNVEWHDLVIPTHGILEMFARGTIMYLALFAIFRFIVQRQRSAIGIPDVLVIVLIADASQNAFAKEYRSITEGLVVVLTIVFWDFLLDLLAYRVKFFAWLVRPAPMALVRKGQLIRRNMRKEMISIDELRGEARHQGIANLKEVREAHLEANGDISFIKQNKHSPRKNPRKKAY
jgi:uncharacterized membrane protein YcaP (DUF421 family)